MPRVVHREYSNPLLRAPSHVEHREYYDGPNSEIEETTEVIEHTRPFSRPPSRSASIISIPAPRRSRRASHHLTDSEDEESVSDYHRSRYRDRRRNRSQTRRSRSRSSHHNSRHSDRDSEGKRRIFTACLHNASRWLTGNFHRSY